MGQFKLLGTTFARGAVIIIVFVSCTTEVVKEVEVIKEVPVEKIVEVVKIIEVPVEVVREVEVFRSVMVMPTPVPTAPPTATPAIPRGLLSSRVLFYYNSNYYYSQLAAYSFEQGIDVVLRKDEDLSSFADKYRGVLVANVGVYPRLGEPKTGDITLLRRFVISGGRAVIFLATCSAALQSRHRILI